MLEFCMLYFHDWFCLLETCVKDLTLFPDTSQRGVGFAEISWSGQNSVPAGSIRSSVQDGSEGFVEGDPSPLRVADGGTFGLILFPNTDALGMVLENEFLGDAPRGAGRHGLWRCVRCPGFGHQQVCS